MAKFIYTGTTKQGEKVSEVVNAPDKYAVYAIARENGHIVTKVSAASGFSVARLVNLEKINYYLSRVKQDELVMMTRNLSAMLKAGLPLSRALSVIERQSKNPRLKGIMQSLREAINRGDQFNVGLKAFPKTFSPLYVSMVRAGEESGGMVDALQTISMQLERSSALKKKVKGAMMYPLIVVSVMLIIGVLMMIFVVPTLVSTFIKLEIELPLATRIIIATSDFLSNNGLIALLGFVLVVVTLVTFARTRVGKRTIHFILVHLPVIGNLVKQTNAAYTARTLSSLLSAGVDVIGAINITEDVIQNLYFKDVLHEAAEKVEKGGQLSETFIQHEKLYPILVGEMILVGEETGQISQMLSELAKFYENEVEQKTKDLSTIIEPILMVTIGVGVGFFALAMIAPIYSISDSIK
ncbi:MAG TPA: type II secretion system F family protein [Candidatus Paceibacterota bacterium]|nr:type II secretion system F family protein [Candidatus Paceibacterota bacterium]